MLASDGIHVHDAALSFDIPVMIAVSFVCLPIFFTGHVIDRWESIVFLFYYATYTLYLILKATEHNALPMFSSVMLIFFVPITVLTLIVVTLHAIRRK